MSGPEPRELAVTASRSVQPVKSGTQLALLAGFGGLLALMAFVGVDSIHVLHQIHLRNVQIRQKFLLRNRALEQIRSALYLSGTFTRDFLLERDSVRAEGHRANLQRVSAEMNEALRTYSQSLTGDEASSFQKLEAEIRSYWAVLEPTFHWNARERQARSGSFLEQELFPRRANTLRIADKIGGVNEQELSSGDEELEEIFDGFRHRLTWMLAVALGLGLALAAVTMHHTLRLARDADLRYREIVLAQGELKDLSARLVDAQEQERRAISRELHDEVGQSLSALLMELGNVSAVAPAGNSELRGHLESIRKLAESSVSVVRNMALLLRPSMLDDLGLIPALQWQAREISKRTGMGVEVIAENVADDLPEEHKTCVYRVVQEALNNCARHAGARHVRIRVIQRPEMIALSVEDDGKGFDSTHVRGLGLLGMEERVTHLGGAFVVRSEPGHGTFVSVDLPLVGTALEAAG
jgi:signal transduction histidine kinase